MTERTARVRLGDADADGVALPPPLADALGVTDGDAVVLTATVGARTVATVSVDGGLPTDGVRLAASLADGLGVDDDARVTVAAATPTRAERVTVAPVADLAVRGGAESVAAALADRPLLVGDTVAVSLLGGSLEVPFRVTDTRPEGVVTTDADTEIDIAAGPAGRTGADTATRPVPPAGVGGYEATVDECRSALVAPLTSEDAYTVGGASAAAGVLLEGQAGVGKTHHVRHAAWRADAGVVRVDAARLARDGRGAVDDYLEERAARATTQPRAIVHVDELGALADDDGSPTARRLGAWIERLREQPGVVVVGETTDAEALPTTLVRGGRLSRRVAVPRPDAAARTAVLTVLTDGLGLASNVDLEAVAQRTLGYVAGDLLAVRARAIEAALARDGTLVSAADFDAAVEGTTPSAVPSVDASVPDVSFDDVGGLEDAKRELVRAVEWPIAYPEALAQLGVDAPAGVLLYGPPGTGKTLLARAVAASTDANFLSVDGPELFDKYVGESEKGVRRVFERAREAAPAVVFFDELDALGSARAGDGAEAPERVVSQLLTELDGLQTRDQVTVIGATNRPDRIDEALLRPGRFDRRVEVPLPDRTAREAILRIHAANKPIADLDAGALAERTEGYSGSDLAALVREACLLALEDRLAETGADPDAAVGDLVVEPRHVEAALDRVGPSLD
jgi:transitional endoplasmic reticulum ATPase